MLPARRKILFRVVKSELPTHNVFQNNLSLFDIVLSLSNITSKMIKRSTIIYSICNLTQASCTNQRFQDLKSLLIVLMLQTQMVDNAKNSIKQYEMQFQILFPWSINI